MLPVLRLPFHFDPSRLQSDLAGLGPSAWLPHFNTRQYEGEWSALPLRSVDGQTSHIYADPTAGAARFADTPLLLRCPYFQEVLATFECPKQSARLLRLGPGALIREHTDHALGFEDNEVRLHIPIATNPLVEFYLSGERIVMQPGEAWYLNLNLPHRLYNGGADGRVHLVVDLEVNPWLRDVFMRTSQSCRATS